LRPERLVSLMCSINGIEQRHRPLVADIKPLQTHSRTELVTAASNLAPTNYWDSCAFMT
jgi:hypothetical protein